MMYAYKMAASTSLLNPQFGMFSQILSHIQTQKLLDLHKSKQGNTTNLNVSFPMENEKSCSGGTKIHDIHVLLTRQMLYQLSYRGSSAAYG